MQDDLKFVSLIYNNNIICRIIDIEKYWINHSENVNITITFPNSNLTIKLDRALKNIPTIYEKDVIF